MWLRLRTVEEKVFVLSSSLRIPDPYPLFESSRNSFSSLGTLDFLSTCLGIDSLIFFLKCLKDFDKMSAILWKLLSCARLFTSLVAQTVKCLPIMQETWVQSLGQEDLLEKEMATHSSIRVWKIPWMEEPGRLQSMGSVAKSRTQLSDFTSLHFRHLVWKTSDTSRLWIMFSSFCLAVWLSWGRSPSNQGLSWLEAGVQSLWGLYFFCFALIPRVYWRRQRHPTPVLLPGKSQGQRSLVGCSPWGR